MGLSRLFKGISAQAVFTGLLVAIVGFGSSFPVVLQGLAGAGATPAQAASGLMALSVAMGLCGILVSLRTRLPVSVAWSTPGAALLATIPVMEGGFAAVVGAFIVCGAMIVIAGLWKPLGRLVGAIPGPIANAMLAGVLFNFCIAPAYAIADHPVMALIIIGVWLAMIRLRRLYAMPVTVLVAAVLIAMNAGEGFGGAVEWIVAPVLIKPQFSFAAVISVAIPLFIVTMASQNIPGVAVLRANGYELDASPMFRDTGLFSLLSAPFGGHAVNLAAITASMCAGTDAHPDPARRYWAAASSGVFYVLFGLFSGAAVVLVGVAPPTIIMAVAGLALLGAFGNAAASALVEPVGREAALVTFILAASGISFLGVGGAFWGLVAGMAVHHVLTFRT